MLEIQGQRIMLDGSCVGFYRHHKTPSVPITNVMGLFDSDCQAAIKSLTKTRRVIDYVWISDIAVRPKWRRQGIGSRILEKVGRAPGTLLACAPGSGVEGGMRMKHRNRLAFYRSLGFTIVEGDKHDYAFKFTPP